MKPISHSAYNKYHTCPQMYKLHYVDRLRPEGNSSALLFGSAIDDALNAVLLKTGDGVETFRNAFTWELAKDCVWLKNDLDEDLFTLDEKQELQGKDLNYVTWACMRKKGRIMIQGYIEKVLPLVEEVHGVQLETKRRPGFIDAVLTLRGYGRVLIDHKTTSRFYKRDAVGESTQLALYASQLEISKVGFITLNKNISKSKVCRKCGNDGTGTRFKSCNSLSRGSRCGGPWDVKPNELGSVQILVDTVKKEEMKLINESINDTETAIKAGHFPKNLASCNQMFGRQCPYFNYCRKGNKAGLVKKEES